MRLALAAVSLAVVAARPLAAQERRPTEADALQKLLQQYDADHDGRITRAEYPRGDEAFKNLDRDKNGVLDAADFALPPTRPARDGLPAAGKDAKTPKVGDEAPDFELPMLGMKGKTVKLSSLRGDRPVALLFGSYT
jgi:hypothetical protein